MAIPRRSGEHTGEESWARSREGSPSELNPAGPEQYHPAAKLARKVALVTGADSGIGRSVAVLFAREGADIALVYPPGAQVEAELTRREVDLSGGRCLLLPGDLSDDAFCRRAVDRCVRFLGRLDILVNGALCLPYPGVRAGENEKRARSTTVSMDSVARLDVAFDSDEFGCSYIVHAAAPRMAPGSCIINAAPVPGRPREDSLGERTSRGSIHSFTRKLAVALEEDGIRVNCVKSAPARNGRLPLPDPSVMAPSFVFLAANPDSCHITGEVVTVLGRRIG